MSTIPIETIKQNLKENDVELSEILSDIFNFDELQRFIWKEFGVDHENIAFAANKQHFIQELVLNFQRRDRLNEIVASARQWRPHNQKLYDLSVRIGLATTIRPISQAEHPELQFESLLHNRSIKNAYEWRTKLATLENRVCRIQIRKKPKGFLKSVGTGFLVADDLVLTNYHVLRDLIESDKPISSDQIVCHFGYFTETDHDKLHNKEGKIYKANTSKWLIRHSTSNDLDYALIKLNRNAALDKVGGSQNQDGEPRGYVAIEEVELNATMPIFILQHANGQPLGIDVNKIHEINEAQRRVRYLVSTDYGSSGAPCFNADWKLVALHHKGSGESMRDGIKYNQGVPIEEIYYEISDELA